MTAAHTEAQIRKSVEIIAREWHRIQQAGDESTFRAVTESTNAGVAKDVGSLSGTKLSQS